MLATTWQRKVTIIHQCRQGSFIFSPESGCYHIISGSKLNDSVFNDTMRGCTKFRTPGIQLDRAVTKSDHCRPYLHSCRKLQCSCKPVPLYCCPPASCQQPQHTEYLSPVAWGLQPDCMCLHIPTAVVGSCSNHINSARAQGLACSVQISHKGKQQDRRPGLVAYIFAHLTTGACCVFSHVANGANVYHSQSISKTASMKSDKWH